MSKSDDQIVEACNDMTDAEFVDFCRDLAVKQGRVQKTGTLRRKDPDDPESGYAEEIIYKMAPLN